MNSTLREAHSTPYIGSSREENKIQKRIDLYTFPTSTVNINLDNENLTEKIDGLFPGIQFNTGSSSSSTDLSQLLQFYNESENSDISEQWMNLYRAQKMANQKQENESPIQQQQDPQQKQQQQQQMSSTNTQQQQQQQQILNKNHSESADNLFRKSCQSSTTSSTNLCGCNDVKTNKNDDDEKSRLKYSINRSMDVLPIVKENFRILEKCCSVDLQKKQISTRLARSKEMPNIADVDDYD